MPSLHFEHAVCFLTFTILASSKLILDVYLIDLSNRANLKNAHFSLMFTIYKKNETKYKKSETSK